ncbi:unnamed protein product [Ixodes pacificus]
MLSLIIDFFRVKLNSVSFRYTLSDLNMECREGSKHKSLAFKSAWTAQTLLKADALA